MDDRVWLALRTILWLRRNHAARLRGHRGGHVHANQHGDAGPKSEPDPENNQLAVRLDSTNATSAAARSDGSGSSKSALIWTRFGVIPRGAPDGAVPAHRK